MLRSGIRRPCQFSALAFAAWVSVNVQSPAARATDLPRERIVYTTRRPATRHLYLFETGSSPKQITDDPALDYDATFSPDGWWIVFCSERSGNPDLYAIDLTHRGPPRQLTRGQSMEAAPAFTPDGQSLLFVSDRDGNAELFAMPFRPRGPTAEAEARNLTANPAGDFRPAVAPDGKTVAFSSDRDSWMPEGHSWPPRAEIYLMDPSGANPRRLTTSGAMSGSPAWARDGRTLFFYSTREGGSFRIWAMDSDGTHQRALTPTDLSALSPAVMPDGRIAFAVKQSDGFQIMSAAADGSDLRLKSGTQPDCRGPAFDHRNGRMVCAGKDPVSSEPSFAAPGSHNEVRLPDRILDLQGVYDAFCSISSDGHTFVTAQSASDPDGMRLVSNHLDGSGECEVFRPSMSAKVWATSWARGADLIVFTTGPQFAPDDAVVDIWTVHPDGSGATNLTEGGFRNNAFPDLTADGSEIVFRSTRDGNKDIYLMNSDGTNVRRITADPADDTMPSISPNGDMIAFSSTAGGGFQVYFQPLKQGSPDGDPQPSRGYLLSVHSRFSPDGKWIVFASDHGGLNDEAPLSDGNAQPYAELFVVPVEGEFEPIRLTHNKWEDSVPCWSVTPRP